MERNIPKHLTSRIPILYLCVVVKITITLTHTTQTHENKDYLAENSVHRHHHPYGHRHHARHGLVHGALTTKEMLKKLRILAVTNKKLTFAKTNKNINAHENTEKNFLHHRLLRASTWFYCLREGWTGRQNLGFYTYSV
jgi:hypothetical protein